MKLHITNLQQGSSTVVIASSFQVNQDLVSLKIDDNKEGVKAALQAIGLRPTSQQDGGLLILQTEQVHIRGGE